MSKSWSELTAENKAQRQAPLADDSVRTRSVPNQRKTKRWCRGKVGVEHKLVVAPHKWSVAHPEMLVGWLSRHCTECGKELGTYIPHSDGRRPREIPDWVAEYLRGVPMQVKLNK